MTTLDKGVTGGRLPPGAIVIGMLLAATIFALDLSLPLGIAAGVPYVALVLVGLRFPAPVALLVLASVGSVLTVAGYYWSEPASEHWMVLVNRTLVLFAIWVVAILGFQRRQREIALAQSRDGLATEVEMKTQAVHQGERRLDLALSAARIGTYARDLDNDRVTWDERAEAVYGMAPGSFDGSFSTFLSVIHSDDRARVRRAAERAIHEDADYNLECRVVWPDRTVHHVSSRAVVIRDQTGTPLQITGVVWDITEREGAEKALRRAHDDLERRIEERTRQLRGSESRLNEAQRIAKIGSWELDLRDNVLTWSDEIYRIFEIDPARFGASYEAFLDTIHPDDRALVDQAYADSLASRTPYEISHRLRMADGRIKWVHEGCETEFDAAGKPLISRGTVQDITERKRTEESLAASETRLSAFLRLSPEAIITTNTDGTVRHFSLGAERIFGFAAEEIMSKPLDILIPRRFRGSHQDHLRKFHHSKDDYRLMNERDEIAGLRKDGTEFPAQASVSMLRVEGETIFTVLLHDITEQKRIEAQLRQVQKMEAVGQLTGGIAHDFNNLLTVVLGNLELLQEDTERDEKQQRYVESAIHATERGAMLTERLLAFSRKQTLHPKGLDLDELVAGMSEMLQRPLGETIEIEAKAADSLWPALADAAQVESALLNLAINARDAMPNGGKLTIETSNVRFDDEYAEAQADIAPGEYVQVSVSDTGTGISSEILEHVFEPFYTTKGVGEGSGLGLSMVYGFAKQSGGHVTIYSEEDRGTTVKLYLPRATHESQEVGSDAAQDEPKSEHETVLVVEDDPDVRTLAVALLGDLGYEVLEADDGPSAIAAIKSRSRIDLLFTDVVLAGGMSGPEVAEEAKRLRPAMRILFTSGYPSEAMIGHGELEQGADLLNKPFRKADLAQKVREVLRKAA